MKRLLQFVGRLYPAPWRRRYGIEFAALLEDVDPDWHTFLNVLRGAVEMQMWTRNFGKILAVAGMASALMGLTAWYAIPDRYASLAVLKIVASPDKPTTNEAMADYVNSVVGQSMSRSSLTQIIRALKLYESERAKISLEDMVSSMKKNISVRPVGRHSRKGVTAFSIQFIYSDPVVAQRVVQELAARSLDSNLNFSLRDKDPDPWGRTLEILDAPSLTDLPFSPRLSMIMTAGTAVALTLGALLALVRRSMRPLQSPRN